MSNPIKPTGGVGGPSAADAVEGAERTEGTSFGARLEASQRVEATGAAPDPLLRAVQEVAADVRAGLVPDAQAATDAVIIRLVDLRYGHLEATRRQGLVVQLHAMLATDPRFQARIEELLASASAAR